MPIAAVPAYLGNEFHDASPALRFGLLLPIWTTRSDQEREVQKRAQARSREGQEVAALLNGQGMEATIHALRARKPNPLPGLWDKNDFAAREAWVKVKVLTSADKDRMKALVDRQQALAQTQTSRLSLEAHATAPFTTGLGNEHPLENGFAFLNPYGLPYLPGSGVKGVLRQAAQELARGEWGNSRGWSEEKYYTLMQGKDDNRRPVLDENGQPVKLSMLDVLFGRETPSGEKDHVRGALSFWDVIPQSAGDSLLVEIMTPHQSHYYQQDNTKGAGSTSPHDSGQPNPICFLTVPPGSAFAFHVVCDEQHLRRLTSEKMPNAPDLLAEGETHWEALLEKAFQQAFQWLGFGAKTAVGYGAMRAVITDTSTPPPTPKGVAGPIAQQSKPSPPSVQPKEERWTNVTLTRQQGGGGVVMVSGAAGKAEARGAQADSVLKTLSPEQAKRLEKKGSLTNLTVLVVIEGNRRTVKAVLPENG